MSAKYGSKAGGKGFFGCTGTRLVRFGFVELLGDCPTGVEVEDVAAVWAIELPLDFGFWMCGGSAGIAKPCFEAATFSIVTGAEKGSAVSGY